MRLDSLSSSFNFDLISSLYNCLYLLILSNRLSSRRWICILALFARFSNSNLIIGFIRGRVVYRNI